MSRAEASRRKIERPHFQSQDGVGVLARWSRCLASSALLLAIGSLHPAIAAPPREPLPEARSGERLSDWLLRQPAAVPATGTRFSPALMWSHPAEVPAQTALKQELLSALSGPGLEALSPLVRWVRTLPATGRVALAGADPRWLQANPDQDPRLGPDQTLTMPLRPATVTVLLADARWCQVIHTADALAADYLRACADLTGSGPADSVWLVQPDGRSLQLGVQPWNAQAQPHPAPGAWLWAPPRALQVPQAASQALARFLGTQGLAEDLAIGDGRLLGPASVSRPASTRWFVASGAPRDLSLSASDWGEIGLLQTPTARMRPAGDARFHWSRVWPYTRGTLMFQPMDWLEAGFRYTDIANRAYGPGNPQSYKDKSIDFKLRLREESAWWPQVSLGVRDIGGTGYFSGEYLVASKRWGDFDASLGLGWGYLGARGDMRNPLSLLRSRFRQRQDGDNVHGGTVNFGALFHGPTALFGGLQWHTPWRSVWLKAEVEGNDYQSEPENNRQPQSTPLNLGVVWRPTSWLDVSLGFERGHRTMIGLTLHGPLGQGTTPKVLDPALPAPQAIRPAPVTGQHDALDWTEWSRAVRLHTGWEVDSVHDDQDVLHLRLSDAPGPYAGDRIRKLITLAHLAAPSRIKQFVVHFDPAQVRDVTVLEVDRALWVRQQTEPSPPALAGRDIRVIEADAAAAPRSAGWHAPDRRLQWGLSPYFSQVLGGPDGFILFQTGAVARARVGLTDHISVSGALQMRLLDNFDKFVTTGKSGLPPVRTFLREYVTTRHVTLPYLQLSHAGRLSADQFYMVYGGMLEPMFGGVGAEWMWRPSGSPIWLSVDVNRVRQRAFEQDLSFRDYQVTTGHLTAHWQTGWQGIVISPSFGQYLAGDRGVTLDINRVFDNGVVMGAFATKTNVSRAVFGEGSFDKGIYVRVPFDAMLARSVTGNANLLWRPLTRDGGAKLARPGLESVTHLRDRRAFDYGPPARVSSRQTGEPVFTAPASR
jgi:hypothetical protein